MNNQRTTTKTIRLHTDLLEVAESKAADVGMNFSDIVEWALSDHLGQPRGVGIDLLERVRAYLLRRYPDRQGFGQDVTLEVFRRIRTDEDMWQLYQSAVSDGADSVNPAARDSLHRRIGKTVKAVLDATAIGRSLPLDPEVELINTHALLEEKVRFEITVPQDAFKVVDGQEQLLLYNELADRAASMLDAPAQRLPLSSDGSRQVAFRLPVQPDDFAVGRLRYDLKTYFAEDGIDVDKLRFAPDD